MKTLRMGFFRMLFFGVFCGVDLETFKLLGAAPMERQSRKQNRELCRGWCFVVALLFAVCGMVLIIVSTADTDRYPNIKAHAKSILAWNQLDEMVKRDWAQLDVRFFVKLVNSAGIFAEEENTTTNGNVSASLCASCFGRIRDDPTVDSGGTVLAAYNTSVFRANPSRYLADSWFNVSQLYTLSVDARDKQGAPVFTWSESLSPFRQRRSYCTQVSGLCLAVSHTLNLGFRVSGTCGPTFPFSYIETTCGGDDDLGKVFLQFPLELRLDDDPYVGLGRRSHGEFTFGFSPGVIQPIGIAVFLLGCVMIFGSCWFKP